MPAAKNIDIDKAREEYRQGRSLRDLAADFGCSHVHLWRVLKEAGEPLRRGGPTEPLPKARAKLHEVHAAHALVLHTNGVPLREIAASLGHTEAWVKQKLKDAGVAT